MGWRTQWFRASQVRFRLQIEELTLIDGLIWVNTCMGHPSNLTSLEAVACCCHNMIIWYHLPYALHMIHYDTVYVCTHVATYSPFLDADDAGFAWICRLICFSLISWVWLCKKQPKIQSMGLDGWGCWSWIDSFFKMPMVCTLDPLWAGWASSKHQLRPWPTKSEGKNGL